MLNSVNHSYTILSPASVSNGSLFSVRSELAGGPGVGGVPPLVNGFGTPTFRSRVSMLHLVRYYCTTR